DADVESFITVLIVNRVVQNLLVRDADLDSDANLVVPDKIIESYIAVADVQANAYAPSFGPAVVMGLIATNGVVARVAAGSTFLVDLNAIACVVMDVASLDDVIVGLDVESVIQRRRAG